MRVAVEAKSFSHARREAESTNFRARYRKVRSHRASYIAPMFYLYPISYVLMLYVCMRESNYVYVL